MMPQLLMKREVQPASKVPPDTCEWCGQSYPALSKERYYSVVVLGVTHKICGDCYDHLEQVSHGYFF